MKKQIEQLERFLHQVYCTLYKYYLDLLLIFVGELTLSFLIIKLIPYTEIDWKAYMEQIEIYLNGERNYTKLEGNTGPCVYPAGYVHVFSLFYYLTDYGKSIQKAQILYAFIYSLTQTIVLGYYRDHIKDQKIPFWTCITICLSKRLHSIYMLRLFNDPICMLFMHTAILLFSKKQMVLGSLFYTAALSIKMNVLLFLPGVMLILNLFQGPFYMIFNLCLIFAFQVLVAYPFLLYDYNAYLSRAFEFSRQFIFKWSVNLQFLGEELFLNRKVHLVLLVLHLTALIFLLFVKFSKGSSLIQRMRSVKLIPVFQKQGNQNLKSLDILKILFSVNFVGIWFARSLHFQFYSWFFHSIPFLSRNPLIVGLFEVVFLIFPTKPIASILFQVLCFATFVRMVTWIKLEYLEEEQEVKAKNIKKD